MDKQVKRLILIVFALILGLGLHYWIRSPALTLPFFHNEDTAGIAYSSNLIIQGGLPYVHTVEMKAPGSFFVLAQWWSWFGNSLENAQVLMFIWSFFAACGIAIGSWFLYGSLWIACLSAWLYIYLSPFTDSIDINYGAWMATPYIFSASVLWWIYRESQIQSTYNQHPTKEEQIPLQSRKLLILYITLGIFIASAALMKRQGAAIFPLALLVIYQVSADKPKALLGLIGGTLLGFTVFFIPYWQQDHLFEGVQSYFFSKSGWHYLASNLIETKINVSPTVEKLPRLWDGLIGTPIHLPITSAMSGLVVIYSLLVHKPNPQSQAEPEKQVTPPIDFRLLSILCAFALLSFVGTALGLRFFKGYYLQMLPALIWLGTYPVIWQRAYRCFISFFVPKSRSHFLVQKLLILIFLASLPFAITSSWHHLSKARKMRSGPLYLPALQIKEISQKIKVNTQADDKIWVWGRWAWPSYYYSERQSATRYFKNLGVLTTQLSNTWNPKRKSAPTRFNPQSPWQEAMTELRAQPPQWIICAKNESYQDFKALKLFLKQHYEVVTYKQLQVKKRSRRALFKVYRLKS